MDEIIDEMVKTPEVAAEMKKWLAEYQEVNNCVIEVRYLDAEED